MQDTARAQRLDVGPDFERRGRKAAIRIWEALSAHQLGEAPRYLLSGGRGAVTAPGDALRRQPFLVATDVDGGGGGAKIRTGLPG